MCACQQSEEGSPAEPSTEIVSEVDGATMVLIPAGTFQMGSTTGEATNTPCMPSLSMHSTWTYTR